VKDEQLTSNGVRWRCVKSFVPRIRGTFADLEAALSRATPLREHRVKRKYEVVDGDATWFIKLYPKQGGLARLKSLVQGTRARHEYEAAGEVARRGVPCVPIDAVAEWKAGGAVFIRKLEGWRTVNEALPDDRLLVHYGEFCRAVHDANVWQDDFNPTNVLLSPTGEMRLIDYERLDPRRAIPERERLRLLAKLVRMPTVGRAGLDRVLEGYMRTGEDLRDRILALAERQARIDRAKLAKNCLLENRTFAKIETPDHVGFCRRGAWPLEEARRKPVDDAYAAWREANLQALDGAPRPVAVLRERKGKRGWVAFEPLPGGG